jgi:hypothetical protein
VVKSRRADIFTLRRNPEFSVPKKMDNRLDYASRNFNWDQLHNEPGFHVLSRASSISKDTPDVYTRVSQKVEGLLENKARLL